MAKPTILYAWDSASTNLAAPTAGHQLSGFANGEIPPSNEQNGWQQNVYLWLLWLATYYTIVKTKLQPLVNGVGGIGVAFSFTTGAAYTASQTSSLIQELDAPQGYKLGLIKFNILSTAANLTTGSFVVTINKVPVDGSASTTVATYTVANGTYPTVSTVQTLNMGASSSGLTVTVAAAGGTYTRSAGSFITDGFFVGQQVQWSGFVNGGNNALKTITALTATVMTVSTTGLVNETGTAAAESVAAVSPTLDDTFSLQIQYVITMTNGAGTFSLYPVRYTMVAQ